MYEAATRSEFLDSLADEFNADCSVLSVAADKPDWCRALDGFADNSIRDRLHVYVPERFDPPCYVLPGTISFGRGYWPSGYNADLREDACPFHDLVREKAYFPIVSPDQNIRLARMCCLMKLATPADSFSCTADRFGDVFARDHVTAAWLKMQTKWANGCSQLASTVASISHFAEIAVGAFKAYSNVDVVEAVNRVCQEANLELTVGAANQECQSVLNKRVLDTHQERWFTGEFFDRRQSKIDIPVAIATEEDNSSLAIYGFRLGKEGRLLSVRWHGGEDVLTRSILTTLLLEIARAILVCAPNRNGWRLER